MVPKLDQDEIGSGEGALEVPLRLWVYYTSVTSNIRWQLPDGTFVTQRSSQVALGGEIFSRLISFGVALHRRPDYFTPDREYCCVRTQPMRRDASLLVGVLVIYILLKFISPQHALCPSPQHPAKKLIPLTNGMITYNASTSLATYSYYTGYILIGAVNKTCEADDSWTPKNRTNMHVNVSLTTVQ